MNYFNDIDNIPYWNFQQIKNKNDLRYLLELDSYLNLDKYTSNDQHVKVFDSIMNQYNEVLIKRPSANNYFDIDKEIMEYNTERYMCLLLVSQIDMFANKDLFSEHVNNCIDLLDEYGYSVDVNRDVKSQCANVIRELDGLITEVLELEKQKNSVSTGQPITDEQLINKIEIYRKAGNIDTKKTSLLQFLEYENDYIKHLQDASNKAAANNR